jgi:hypothetical protein
MVELPKLSTAELVGGAAAITALAGVGVAAAVIHHRKKSRKRKTARSKNTRKKLRRSKGRRKLKFGSKAYRKKYLKHGKRKQKKPYTAGNRKDTSRRRIRYTKNNQPYVLTSSGRARFISKKSVHNSQKRKGGKY